MVQTKNVKVKEYLKYGSSHGVCRRQSKVRPGAGVNVYDDRDVVTLSLLLYVEARSVMTIQIVGSVLLQTRMERYGII